MKTCEFCGRAFEPKKKKVVRPRFCSRACVARMMNRLRRGTHRRKARVPCADCGQLFMTGSFNSHARCPRCNTQVCESCGREFIPARAYRRQRFCSHRCFGLVNTRQRGDQRGPKSLVWKGERATEKWIMAYRGPQWPAISRQVMARDNYTCQSCGAQPGQREISYIHGRTGKLVRYRKWMLHVHHIDGFSRYAPELYDQFNDPSRLITLCLSSHNKVHPRSREGG